MYQTTTPDRSLAQAKEKPIVKFGLDVHADQITVCRMQEGSLPQPAQKMSPQKALSWIIGHVEDGLKVHSCYEAGPCGFWLHRALVAQGVVNVVVAPQRWDTQGKRVKTDKRDARELADRLDRYLRGNSAVFSLVRVPTPEQEQRRSLARQRGALMKERNRCILRGRSMMLLQGIKAPLSWWHPLHWCEFATTLPEWMREQAALWQAKAAQFEKELERLDGQLEASLRGKLIPKGLGALSAALLEAEILDWSRFKNRRAVSSFTGLCPSERSSGATRIQGSVNKHGNPRVRHYLVEAVWRLERWQPQYPPIGMLARTSGNRSRKRAAVAVARRLAVDLWRIATGQCSAQKLGLKLVAVGAPSLG